MIMKNNTPVYRCWHFPTSQMCRVKSIRWDEYPHDTSVMAISTDRQINKPFLARLGDLLLMRKSSFTDANEDAIFSGDIMQFDSDSKYPNEIFTVTDVEDDLCASCEGINIPIWQAVSVHKAKVVGNVFQDPSH